jgi:hypothetical protein
MDENGILKAMGIVQLYVIGLLLFESIIALRYFGVIVPTKQIFISVFGCAFALIYLIWLHNTMCWSNILSSFTPLQEIAHQNVTNQSVHVQCFSPDCVASNTAAMMMNSFDYKTGPLSAIRPAVFYINMLSNIERNAYFIQRMTARGIQPTRVPAVSSKLFNESIPGTIQGKIDPNFFAFDNLEIRVPKVRAQSINEIATTCSHLLAVRKAYDANDTYAIIVEDDAEFDYESMWGGLGLEHVIGSAPSNWNIIQVYTYILSDELAITLLQSLRRGTVDYIQHRVECALDIIFINQGELLTKRDSELHLNYWGAVGYLGMCMFYCYNTF